MRQKERQLVGTKSQGRTSKMSTSCSLGTINEGDTVAWAAGTCQNKRLIELITHSLGAFHCSFVLLPPPDSRRPGCLALACYGTPLKSLPAQRLSGIMPKRRVTTEPAFYSSPGPLLSCILTIPATSQPLSQEYLGGKIHQLS